MSETEDTEESGPRSFAVFIRTLADGEAEEAISGKLYELLAALREAAENKGGSAKGELTLKLSIAVDARDQVAIKYDVKTKEPAPDHPSAVMWLDKKGHITAENPRQQKLPLREVPRAKVKDIQADAKPVRQV